jgi:hypothetical protein
MTQFPWIERCRDDAAAILAYMEEQSGRGVLTFSINKLSSALRLNRWRVYGGLVVLVQIEESVNVTSADADQAEFYLPRNLAGR